jgi:peroxiredoxin family protein
MGSDMSSGLGEGGVHATRCAFGPATVHAVPGPGGSSNAARPTDPTGEGPPAPFGRREGRDPCPRNDLKGCEMDGSTLSLVLFSGTDDRLNAAAVLTAGAAAMGRKVNVFLQYWALDAFRADRIMKEHGVAPEAGPEGAELFQRHPGLHWSEILRQAKDVGEVRIHACSLSMEMFAIEVDDLDPLVDDQEGVASFFMDVDGPVTFI